MNGGPDCVVCDQPLIVFGSGRILGRVEVDYYECPLCGLVCLPDPSWLDQAYSAAISAMDVGLLGRCATLADHTSRIVRAQRLEDGTFLDWAGGYGTLTRMMRDRGFNYFHWDVMCENMFAQGFVGAVDHHYDVVTAYEVLEHLTNPRASLKQVAQQTDLLLFTTYLLPNPAPSPADWWYYAPETGQHVTFFSMPALKLLGHRLEYKLISDGVSRHAFYRGDLRPMTRLLFSPLLAKVQALRVRGQAVARQTAGHPGSLTAADSVAIGRSLRLRPEGRPEGDA